VCLQQLHLLVSSLNMPMLLAPCPSIEAALLLIPCAAVNLPDVLQSICQWLGAGESLPPRGVRLWLSLVQTGHQFQQGVSSLSASLLALFT
jgi:hypothetical protein